MKKFWVFFCAVITCTVFAETKNITWKVDGATYATSTCEVGGDLIIPQTNPTKYGYHFVGWDNLYTFLEYIESTGTQYIDTGITLGNALKEKYEVDFQMCNLRSGGMWGTLGETRSGTIWIDANTFKVSIGGSASGASSYLKSADLNRHSVFFEATLKANEYMYSIKMDNDPLFSSGYSYASISRSLHIMMGWSFGSKFLPVSARFYAFKLYLDDTLVRDFIPAKRRSDNAIGMYDTVTDTFFTNAGTGTFIAGPVK